MNNFKNPTENLKTLNIFSSYLKKYWLELPQPLRANAFNLLLETKSEIEKQRLEIRAYKLKQELIKGKQTRLFE